MVLLRKMKEAIKEAIKNLSQLYKKKKPFSNLNILHILYVLSYIWQRKLARLCVLY